MKTKKANQTDKKSDELNFDGIDLMKKYGFELFEDTTSVQNDKNANVQIVSVKEGWKMVFKDLPAIKTFFEEIDDLVKNYSVDELWNHILGEFVSFEYSMQHNLAIQAKNSELIN